VLQSFDSEQDSADRRDPPFAQVSRKAGTFGEEIWPNLVPDGFYELVYRWLNKFPDGPAPPEYVVGSGDQLIDLQFRNTISAFVSDQVPDAYDGRLERSRAIRVHNRVEVDVVEMAIPLVDQPPDE
jgi:hypothetical protein